MAKGELPTPLNINQLLQHLRAGSVLMDIQDEVQGVMTAVHVTGKKGEVTIKLTFAASSEGTHQVTAAVSSKRPKATPKPDMLFHDSVGGQFLQQPNQLGFGKDDLSPRRASRVSDGNGGAFDTSTGEVTQ